MQNNTETILEMGLLSELAYLRLEHKFWNTLNNDNLKRDFNNIGDLVDFFNEKDEDNNPIKTGISPDRQDDIIKLLSKYEIVEFYSEDEYSSQAMLLKDKTTGKYIISYRGTQERIDWFSNAYSGLLNLNPQYSILKSFTSSMIEKYNLNNSNLTITGHSLGGFLAQQACVDFKIKGYTFNSWGASHLVENIFAGTPLNSFERTIRFILEKSGIYNSANKAWAKDNVLNVSLQDSGIVNGDILSNLLTGLSSEFLGIVLPIFGSNVGLLDGHGMVNLNKTFEQYEKIVDCFSSVTLLQISLALGIKGYEKGLAEFEKMGIYDFKNLSFVDIFDKKINETFFGTNKAPLYALINLNPFIINGNLKVYEDINPDDYSEQYLKDRSQMLYYMMNDDELTMSDNWYQDRALNIDVNDKSDITGYLTFLPDVIFNASGFDANDENHHRSYHIYGNDNSNTIITNKDFSWE